MLIYDLEIINAIPPKAGSGFQHEEGITYCAGWHDHDHMGISVLVAFDYLTQDVRVFCQDNLALFQRLVDQRDVVAGFNSIEFDNQVCAANGIHVPVAKSYDLLREIWAAHGLGPTFRSRTHGGFGLDACAQANGLAGKTGHGALAPVQWQRGEIGTVVDYCIQDVLITKRLLAKVMHGTFICPKTFHTLNIRKPL